MKHGLAQVINKASKGKGIKGAILLEENVLGGKIMETKTIGQHLN